MGPALEGLGFVVTVGVVGEFVDIVVVAAAAHDLHALRWKMSNPMGLDRGGQKYI